MVQNVSSCSSKASGCLPHTRPIKYHVHRILTDLAWPWVEGYRRPPYWLDVVAIR